MCPLLLHSGSTCVSPSGKSCNESCRCHLKACNMPPTAFRIYTASYHTNTAASPKNWRMLPDVEKYECLKGYNPNSAGRWNRLLGIFYHEWHAHWTPLLQFGFPPTGSMYIGDFSMAKDATGNRVGVCQQFQPAGWKNGLLFFPTDRLPVRSITWKKLVPKLYAGKITQTNLSPGRALRNERTGRHKNGRHKKISWTDLVADRKQRIQKLEADNTLENWYARSLQPAHPSTGSRGVNNSYLDRQQIEKLMNEPGSKGTFLVWIQWYPVFDAAKPKKMRLNAVFFMVPQAG